VDKHKCFVLRRFEPAIFILTIICSQLFSRRSLLSLTKEVAFSLTSEENFWLTKQLNLTDEVIRQVPLSNDVIKEMIHLSVGVPTKDLLLLPKILKIFMERVWRLMSVQAESSESLTNEQIGKHFTKFGAIGITMLLLKKETRICGRIEQLKVHYIRHCFIHLFQEY
jgi:hypothetical protein